MDIIKGSIDVIVMLLPCDFVVKGLSAETDTCNTE